MSVGLSIFIIEFLSGCILFLLGMITYGYAVKPKLKARQSCCKGSVC